ncbi:MAG TPA: helix-hairpin-helix domain-containing protein [Firmicutes bacterium]|uniref:Helix-hairpin-helix domain-containing protein n=1 Tax=Capillibacterium thermochitinicola TaxID=2699427 RepID=A0A8J6I2M5_9FIRM|nr:helix-hairpin-helix domain-containing protein [Capillibacterium thermochitinicola]MBA2133132.1 helix-hairpin-helix domain-containing protein [Capillibacterium thermochitinicola]HHW11823.1 helix-hairpin-helix domain-containing protein [Bacillota bacterium]
MTPPDESGPAAGAQGEPAEETAPPAPGDQAVEEEAASFRLDPNTASYEELQTLPGIGPVLAARIIEYRETMGKFRTIDDLLAVKGIGEKTLAKIRPYLVIKE